MRSSDSILNFFSAELTPQSSKKNDFSNVFQHEKQGIPEKDLLAFKAYAEKQDVILLFRPVEPLTKILHESGKYPTKNFKIKGKSASWGLWAGFIPTDQRYSKLIGQSEKIIESNKAIQACIHNKQAQPVHLKIPESYFQELKKKEIIFSQKKKEGDYLVIYCPHPGFKKLELCYAKKIETQSRIEYEVYTAAKEPFYVLADTHLKRPLIADYDLLALVTPWEDYSKEHIRLNPDVTLQSRLRKLSPKAQRRSGESIERFYAREDPNLGNVSPITETHIHGLNTALNKGLHLECIHHNDDAGSPASNPKTNYPMTAIIPPLAGFDSRIFLIETTEEFVDFINKLNKTKKYRVEANPLWELPVKWAANRNHFFYNILIAYKTDSSLKNMKEALLTIFKSIHLDDKTFSDELTHLFEIMAQIKFREDKPPLKKFFDVIQNSLFTNSSLLVALSRTLEILQDNKVLSQKTIDQLLRLNKMLRNDIPDFYKILGTLKNLAVSQGARMIDDYLEHKQHIYNNKLDLKNKDYEEGLLQLRLHEKTTNATTQRFSM